MLSREDIYIEKYENFVRQSYRSRCYILGANGVIPLIVPVRGSRKKILIKDIKIENDELWQAQHLKSIMSAYGNAPFFEHYFPLIESFYSKKYTRLFDLCIASLTLCLKMLDISKKWQVTDDYQKYKNLVIMDLRNEFKAKELNVFPDFFQSLEYFQLFGKQFASNLSTLDLIFCEGPRALAVLRGSYEVKKGG